MRDALTWRNGLAVIAAVVVLGGARPAAAQNPTFDVEGVVIDAQQAVLPGVDGDHSRTRPPG